MGRVCRVSARFLYKRMPQAAKVRNVNMMGGILDSGRARSDCGVECCQSVLESSL